MRRRFFFFSIVQLEKFLQVLDLSHAVMLLALHTVRCIVVEVLRWKREIHFLASSFPSQLNRALSSWNRKGLMLPAAFMLQ